MESDMATIIEREGDSGASGLLALVVIVAAIVVALFAFGAFNAGPVKLPAPGGSSSTEVNVNTPAPSTPAPSTPTPSSGQ
jgi:hypothetical protein